VLRLIPIIALLGCQPTEGSKSVDAPAPTSTPTVTPTPTVTTTTTTTSNEAMAAFVADVQANLDETGVPGASVAVVYQGETFTETFGVRNLLTGEPVTTDTRFMFASTSKMFTTTTIALLAQDGLVDVHAPISEVVPGMAFEGGEEAEITLDLLMSHNAGLPPFLDTSCDDPEESLQVYVDRQLPWPVWVAPRTLWYYSNAGFALVSRSLETITGDPFEQVLLERVFLPADMSETTFDFDPDTIATGPTDPTVLQCTGVRAAGGVWGSATDMAHFGEVLVGQRDIGLTDASLTQLQSASVPTARGAGIDYGWGLFREPYRGLSLLGHGGTVNGYGASILTVPDQGFVVVIMLNGFTASGDPFELGKRAIDHFLEPPEPLIEPTPDVELWRSWEGTYVAADGASMQGQVVNDRMNIVMPGSGARVPVTWDAGETFLVGEGGLTRVSFWTDEDGTPEWLSTPWGIGAYQPVP
jgi:CubicO group peptidase (beta-lactamase class C family)